MRNAIEEGCIKTCINSDAVLRDARIQFYVMPRMNGSPRTSSQDAAFRDARLQFDVMPEIKKLCTVFALGKGASIAGDMQ